MPLHDGQRFAGYTIVRTLGFGGMGEVYLARHPRLPRYDALKILPTEVSADEEYRGRFEREADLASALWHPHIVGVHDRGEADGQLWISMDFVDGQDTSQLLADRYPEGMSPTDVAAIVTAVASALDYAHNKGLLHRDVKPANIMMTHPDDLGAQRILLADFGIARAMNDISGLTATNMTVGTVAYSAPEQLLGELVDSRADQYSLAASAYHLLTGKTVFAHSNPAVVISRHLTADPPPVSATKPTLAATDPIFAAALAKDPNDRFGRCADFARALAEQLASRKAVSAAPTTPAQPLGKPSSTSPSPDREQALVVTQKAPAATQLPAHSTEGTTSPAPRSRRFAVVASILAAVITIGVGVSVWQPWQPSVDTGAAASSSPSSPPPPAEPTSSPISSPPTSAAPTATTTTAAPPPLAPVLPLATLGEYCTPPDAEGMTSGGDLSYCSRVQYTDAYKWAPTPGVIPNPTVTFPQTTQAPYPTEDETYIQICMQKTRQTREKCIADIQRGIDAGQVRVP
jgi:serine/threonine protein kinase, bacterial